MQFKLGDKVRIHNKDASLIGSICLENGLDTEVVMDLGEEGIAVRDPLQGGWPVALSHEEAIATLVKIEGETKLTKKVAVAKRASTGHEIDEHLQFVEGDTFDILTEPIDLMTVIVFGQLKAHGDLERAVVIHIGEEKGFMVLFTEEDEAAFNFNELFTTQEVA